MRASTLTGPATSRRSHRRRPQQPKTGAGSAGTHLYPVPIPSCDLRAMGDDVPRCPSRSRRARPKCPGPVSRSEPAWSVRETKRSPWDCVHRARRGLEPCEDESSTTWSHAALQPSR